MHKICSYDSLIIRFPILRVAITHSSINAKKSCVPIYLQCGVFRDAFGVFRDAFGVIGDAFGVIGDVYGVIGEVFGIIGDIFRVNKNRI